ncbi:hypothetical protein DL346_20475 [Paenibacillus montanisoli]|uniref:Transposase IS116/IS110/IS902 C-terminal domain-containing protein n=1 Tax=Paenibacillus montanisoli TaxID=2081970 RepID=A0A328TVU0_9BACL|nr:hypothetical protein DL346_20475 [Paenibacillus montanisoli]
MVHAREAAKEDANRSRLRMFKFFSCVISFIHQRPSIAAGRKNTEFGLPHSPSNTKPCKSCLRKCCMPRRDRENRMSRLENALLQQATTGAKLPLSSCSKLYRGVARLTAITIVAEIGTFARFRSPAQLVAYLGLVSREYSSGQTTRRGSMPPTSPIK